MKWWKKQERGSFTVEASLIMPFVLACIFLILVMTFYLHDQVVLDSFATELVHSDLSAKKCQTEFKNTVTEKTLLVKSITCSSKSTLNQKTVQWKKKLYLPISSFLGLVLKSSKISLSGRGKNFGWNMTAIMRMKQALD